MSHTDTRNSFHVGWAVVLGLTASTLLGGTAVAEPPTTTDVSGLVINVPAIRDQWYLDAAAPSIAPAISAQARDIWYLDEFAPSTPLVRLQQSPEDG
jgi:hypothetical protein